MGAVFYVTSNFYKTSNMVDAMTPTALASTLSPREEQILDLVAEGLTNREIGARLGVVEKTVKNTMTRILMKLGLHGRTQAAVFITRLRSGEPTRRTA